MREGQVGGGQNSGGDRRRGKGTSQRGRAYEARYGHHSAGEPAAQQSLIADIPRPNFYSWYNRHGTSHPFSCRISHHSITSCNLAGRDADQA